MPTIVWPGTPGETFTNDTDKILYQFVCSWVNTCGQCAQYHLAIAKWWGKMHHGCACISRPVYPGKASSPYEDWHEIVDNLPPDQQKKLVGASNFALIEKGVVKWDDVVTSTRVRLLREVVSRSKLTVDDLTKAGVDGTIAKKAHASVTTPAHILAQQQRQGLIDQITALGVQPKTIADAVAQGLTQRIGLGGHRGGPGPGAGIPGVGPQPMPKAGPTRQDWIRRVLGMIRPPTPRPSTAPEPPPAPTLIQDFARAATTAAKAVPEDQRIGDDRVWIVDAFEEFRSRFPGATLDEFKTSLIDANIERLITLARSDMPGALSKALRAKDAASETTQGIAVFHQIRLRARP